MFQIYFWSTFVISFLLLRRIPTRMGGWDDLAGTLMLSVFGCFLWPLYLAAAIVAKLDGRGQ